MTQQTAHDAGEQAIDLMMSILEPHIDGILRRINIDEFTTVEFIQALQLDSAAKAAYDQAVASWPESDDRLSRLVLHGQVIPQLLRRSNIVEWAGYAYGEDDPYGVPAWWRRTVHT